MTMANTLRKVIRHLEETPGDIIKGWNSLFVQREEDQTYY